MASFNKVLVANRGEIALRVIRACREMGIRTVAIHSTADEKAMHVRLADEAVCVGPAQSTRSYLNKASIVTAATITNADAIHPGYGFLSENADFAEMVTDHNITFIGPAPEAIRTMGDKVAAKRAALAAGLPIVPGSDGAVPDEEAALKIGRDIGYPVLVKAASGGGGRGMKVARNDDELRVGYRTARTEAKAAFGDDTVYIEKYLTKPRHIEVQVLADGHGNVVHLGERDCSLQRKHQKVLEEAGSPILDAATRDRIGRLAADATKALGYENAGTMEFLYEDGEFYFIEMNTRLQVEHPVTEMICGLDLVREQIRIAEGQPLGYGQEDIQFTGHAIECRINAESPFTFVPSPGHVHTYHPPGGLGIRVDSALYSGYDVPPHYDSMIAKLIVSGPSRDVCLGRLRRALGEFVIDGIETSIPLHRALVDAAAIQSGDYHIHWLEQFVQDLA